ncbi:uncharacterized protein METZ01_LOCUS50630, partial [marine metagenome]
VGVRVLAPRSNYWHCKNLTRLHIPELHRAIYTRVPIPYGDLDYRFAVSAMIDAGYDGMVGIEDFGLAINSLETPRA